ncbi:DNA-binding transcriptional regulator ModE [Shigella dysenteriae]|uniref:DNA-binding transcriptional regulator ModE n=1 Tax=Shigella dysenteriae TaxID=622 RepID=A0A2X2IF91_SHIDY|nr:DNA-binding transcriptional regulator ModE [Shigella dysenteriae]
MAFVFRHNKTFARTLLCRPKSFSPLSSNKNYSPTRAISLLKHIALSGSISQGAKDAGISYKSAWDAINEMNQLSEHILVERATGGKGGGGAALTRYGQRLIQLYDLLAQIQQKAFDVLSDDDALPLNSLLAAISRFSLQTSP